MNACERGRDSSGSLPLLNTRHRHVLRSLLVLPTQPFRTSFCPRVTCTWRSVQRREKRLQWPACIGGVALSFYSCEYPVRYFFFANCSSATSLAVAEPPPTELMATRMLTRTRTSRRTGMSAQLVASGEAEKRSVTFGDQTSVPLTPTYDPLSGRMQVCFATPWMTSPSMSLVCAW